MLIMLRIMIVVVVVIIFIIIIAKVRSALIHTTFLISLLRIIVATILT